MKKAPIFFLGLFVMFCSCKDSSQKNTSPFCENELALISPDSGVKVFELNYSQSSDSLRDWILVQLDTVNCVRVQPFGIRLNIGIVLNAQIEQACGVVCGLGYGRTQILINTYDQLLYNHELCELDSLTEQLVKDFGMSRRPHSFFYILMSWDSAASIRRIEKTMVNLAKGYLTVADSFANQKYKKGVCHLDAVQLSTIRKELPFNFSFIEREDILPLPSSEE